MPATPWVSLGLAFIELNQLLALPLAAGVVVILCSRNMARVPLVSRTSGSHRRKELDAKPRHLFRVVDLLQRVVINVSSDLPATGSM